MKTHKFFIVFLIFFAIGCASPKLMVKNVQNQNLEIQTKEGLDLLIEPHESLGIKETEALKNGNVSVFPGVFPEILFGEYCPGRIRWNAWVVDENGIEVFSQMIFSGISFSGDFSEIIIIDLPIKTLKNPKCLVFSTLLEYGYDLFGNEVELNQPQLQKSPAYRKELILSKGTALDGLKEIKNFSEVLKKWNRFQTPDGILISPIGESEVKLVSGINPKYNFAQKLIGEGKFSISMDPISTALGIGIDVFRATRAMPTTGWDYNSQVPSRRNMGLIIKYVCELKQRLIDDINRANAKIIFSKE